ncbi:BLUF domain-containing protein [Hymenobacter sp. BT683]|uniref:BLUF domain-containing protein n=1 Tax=Hymenobacter jeongseonensis TaxID=2791027 RepID=A0ABS0IG76_9BACT|nr:BLUF domain-containing protein [Hymenobacter jeongseonensis]MBF9237369.1 BLUF domain-containing protein [Hymenobacter jeongseonensis]
MGLYQLIYQSQALVPFEQPELLALLHQARDFNRVHHITGVLLYTPDGRFMQVLEGEQSVVRDLYFNRIVADPRHYNCRVIADGPCLQRSFADWTMGFRIATAVDLRNLLCNVPPDVPGLLVPRPHTRPELLELLQEFVANGEPEPWMEVPRS